MAQTLQNPRLGRYRPQPPPPPYPSQHPSYQQQDLQSYNHPLAFQSPPQQAQGGGQVEVGHGGSGQRPDQHEYDQGREVALAFRGSDFQRQQQQHVQPQGPLPPTSGGGGGQNARIFQQQQQALMLQQQQQLHPQHLQRHQSQQSQQPQPSQRISSAASASASGSASITPLPPPHKKPSAAPQPQRNPSLGGGGTRQPPNLHIPIPPNQFAGSALSSSSSSSAAPQFFSRTEEYQRQVLEQQQSQAQQMTRQGQQPSQRPMMPQSAQPQPQPHTTAASGPGARSTSTRPAISTVGEIARSSGRMISGDSAGSNGSKGASDSGESKEREQHFVELVYEFLYKAGLHSTARALLSETTNDPTTTSSSTRPNHLARSSSTSPTLSITSPPTNFKSRETISTDTINIPSPLSSTATDTLQRPPKRRLNTEDESQDERKKQGGTLPSPESGKGSLEGEPGSVESGGRGRNGTEGDGEGGSSSGTPSSNGRGRVGVVPLRKPRVGKSSEDGKGQLLEWWTLFSELSGIDSSFSIYPSPTSSTSSNPKQQPLSDAQVYLSSIRSHPAPGSSLGRVSAVGSAIPNTAGGGAGSGGQARQAVGPPERSAVEGAGEGSAVHEMSPQEAWMAAQNPGEALDSNCPTRPVPQAAPAPPRQPATAAMIQQVQQQQRAQEMVRQEDAPRLARQNGVVTMQRLASQQQQQLQSQRPHPPGMESEWQAHQLKQQQLRNRHVSAIEEAGAQLGIDSDTIASFCNRPLNELPATVRELQAQVLHSGRVRLSTSSQEDALPGDEPRSKRAKMDVVASEAGWGPAMGGQGASGWGKTQQQMKMMATHQQIAQMGGTLGMQQDLGSESGRMVQSGQSPFIEEFDPRSAKQSHSMDTIPRPSPHQPVPKQAAFIQQIPSYPPPMPPPQAPNGSNPPSSHPNGGRGGLRRPSVQEVTQLGQYSRGAAQSVQGVAEKAAGRGSGPAAKPKAVPKKLTKAAAAKKAKEDAAAAAARQPPPNTASTPSSSSQAGPPPSYPPQHQSPYPSQNTYPTPSPRMSIDSAPSPHTASHPPHPPQNQRSSLSNAQIQQRIQQQQQLQLQQQQFQQQQAQQEEYASPEWIRPQQNSQGQEGNGRAATGGQEMVAVDPAAILASRQQHQAHHQQQDQPQHQQQDFVPNQSSIFDPTQTLFDPNFSSENDTLFEWTQFITGDDDALDLP